MTTLCLQLQHHLGEPLMSDFVLELFLVRLRDLVVLTIDTAQIAIPEEDVTCASGSNEGGFFTEVRRVGGDDWQTARVAGGDFVFQSVVKAVARTDCAALEETFESFDALEQFA